MELVAHIALILAACLLDAVFGDPIYPAHPIRVLGAWSLRCEKALFAIGLNGYFGGVLHWLLVVGGALTAWFGVRCLLVQIHPGLGWLWDVFLAYSLTCVRDLLVHGQRVLRNLDDLPAARRQLAMLVSRDTDALPRDAVVRATIESLSENLTDGVLTPLWALALFGLPGLIVVKAVSSLDSMVGYKNDRYRRFGWAGARSDDLVHWLPARLSVPLIALAAALLRLHPHLAWLSAWRYHGLLPSPNSGWSEAACAGALRVRLIGPIRYRGQLATDIFMGDPAWPADLDGDDLRRALRLVLISSVLALLVALALAPLRGWMPW
ncbi:MAG: cobalamin biosynthesis protein CobD [Gammaproteobacteria bacterium]|nr:cobalamin biosynthesis protein CobD [Gammaproteobacteria bacterium]